MKTAQEKHIMQDMQSNMRIVQFRLAGPFLFCYIPASCSVERGLGLDQGLEGPLKAICADRHCTGGGIIGEETA